MNNQTKSNSKSKQQPITIGRFTIIQITKTSDNMAKFRRSLMSPTKPPTYISYWRRSQNRSRKRRSPSKIYKRSKFGITK